MSSSKGFRLASAMPVILVGLALYSLAHAFSLTGRQDSELDGVALRPEPVHSETAGEILSRLKDHYRSVTLDDELSRTLLDRYLAALDPNRIYFLASDVKGFQRYRNKLDDQLKDGELDAAYLIYDRYASRSREAVGFMLALLEQGLDELDLGDDEQVMLDRSEAEWPANEDEAEDLWRRRLEEAVIAMRLDEEPEERIVERLTKRYENQLARLNQNTSEDVFQAYMNSFTEIFDPHTNYFTPHKSENFNISMSRSLEGIGAVLQAEDEYTKVVRLVPGGPAAKAGQLKPADRIIGVAQDDQEMVNIIGWRLDEVVNLIRGPKGTKVRLEIIPATGARGAAREISIVRNKVVLEDQAAKSDVLSVPHGDQQLKIGVISLPAFYIDFDAYHRGDPNYTSTTRDVARLLLSLQKDGIDGLVLDLRDNGGGSLQEATQLVSLFINRGPTVQVRDAGGGITVLPDQYPGTLYNGPMAVLVNRYSASASEIFAGAMQDYGRALIIGDQTFGKGTVQTLQDLDHGQLKITQAKFYRVSGGSNQHRGILPDVSFPFLVDKNEIGESALPNALPWDQIRSARYTPMTDLAPFVDILRERHDQRVAQDPEFDYVREQISLLDEQMARTHVSLNQAKRKQELDTLQNRRLAIENALRKHRGLPPFKDVAAMHADDTSRAEAAQSGEEMEAEPDPYLAESGLVLADLISMMAGQQLLAIEDGR